MKTILGVIFLLTVNLTFSQNNIEATIRSFYKDLNAGDSVKLSSYFLPNAQITFVAVDSSITQSVLEFSKRLVSFRTGEFQESIEKIETLESPIKKFNFNVFFKFYKNDKFVFCGVDEFVFLLTNDGFKIDKIYSSASGCDKVEVNEKDELNELMSKWHSDVAKFDLGDYFNFMDTSFIFLGTDPTERWTKTQFYTFCKPYFDKKSTWDFKMNWRNVYLSDDRKTAWFEESLNTQMDECRGSGVLVKVDGKWKITHYNLTVLIENEKMKAFLQLRAQ